MVFTTASRTQIHDSDRRWIWKFCFRIVATVFSLVGIGCTAWAVSANAHLKDTTQQGFWLVVWLLIPLGSSVIWNIINFIVLAARNKAIHPGANVGVDLVLWMAFITTGVIASFGVDEDLKSEGNFRYSYSYYYSGVRSKETCPGFDSCEDALEVLKKRGQVEAAGVAFAFAAMVLHFALFVAACIDVNKRNRLRDEQRTLKVAESIIAGMEKRGQLPYQRPTYQPAQPSTQQSSYYAPTQPTYQPSHQPSYQPHLHQTPIQPYPHSQLQPRHHQLQQPTSPVSPEMRQVQPQRTTNSTDPIESSDPPHMPERSVVRDDVSPKGRSVLGLN